MKTNMQKITKALRNELLEISGQSEDFLNLPKDLHILINLAANITNSNSEGIINNTRELITFYKDDLNVVLHTLNTPLPVIVLPMVPSVYNEDTTTTIMDQLMSNVFLYAAFTDTVVDYGILTNWDYEPKNKMSFDVLTLLSAHFKMHPVYGIKEFIKKGFKIIRKDFYNKFITTNELKAEYLKNYFANQRDTSQTSNFPYNIVHDDLLLDAEFIKYVINAECDSCYKNLLNKAVFLYKTSHPNPYLLEVMIDNFKPDLINYLKGSIDSLDNDLKETLTSNMLNYIGEKENPVLDCLRLFIPETIDTPETFQKVVKSIKNNLKFDKFPNISPSIVEIVKHSKFSGVKLLNIHIIKLSEKLNENKNISIQTLFETILPFILTTREKDLYLNCNPAYLTPSVLKILAADSFEHIIKIEKAYPDMFE